MKFLKSFLVFLILSTANSLVADGLLIPAAEDYPKDFLKNRMTHVTIKIHGIVAETSVYQEFVNEWNDSTDAVYSFPLPVDARATGFFYWHNDIKYRAVLKVNEQATNPGTGEGGIIARVNQYIGRNGIKVSLKGIKAGNIQRVQLDYISLCDYYKGEVVYRFPLNTQDVITYPVEHVQLSLFIDSRTNISSYTSDSHPGFFVVSDELKSKHLEFSYPKSFLNKDFNFVYQTDISELGVDFFSVKEDTSNGHFALFVRPQNESSADSIIGQRVFFLLSNSSSMLGKNLDQSVNAIKYSIDQLKETDQFNIIVFNFNSLNWQSSPVFATGENVTSANNFLDAVNTSSGNRLNIAVDACLSQIKDSNLLNSILVFTNGRSALDPHAIEANNIHKAGIFPFAIGSDLSYARLEMMAALNYGFVTYLSEEENLATSMQRVISQISQPLLKNAVMEFGSAGVIDLSPQKIPSVYSGSYFSVAGRYENPGPSAMSFAGEASAGYTYYDFNLNFSDSSGVEKFVETLWAKRMIDNLEWQIEIYGETDELKAQLIELSLKYNIRCRYTAYIADYVTEDDTPISILSEEFVIVPKSFIQGNFPNPFNPLTKIRIFLGNDTPGKVKLLKIYDILGRLVAVIDISNLATGWHNINFDAGTLSSGFYFVRLQIGSHIYSTLKMNLVR